MPSHWQNYMDAAHRKVQIAAFHNQQLTDALRDIRAPLSDLPSISIQASFEGVVIAVVAAIDQVAQATNSALNLGLAAGSLFEGSAPEIERRVPEFRDRRQNPIGRDLRIVRTRMVHYSYAKTPSGDPTWQVEMANRHYEGPRDLSSYAAAAVAYGTQLDGIAEKLLQALAAELEATQQ